LVFVPDDHSCRKCGDDYREQIGQKIPEVVQDLSEVVATAAEDGEDRITSGPFEGASGKATVYFHVSDLGLDGAAPSEESLQGRGEPSS